MRKVKLFKSYILILIILCATSFVYGSGSISGTVSNTSSAGIAYATVVAMQDGESVAGDTAYDGGSSGQYTLDSLPAGTYDLHILADGYEFRIEEDVVVTDGQQTTKNITNLAAEGKITGTITKADETTAISGATVLVNCSTEVTLSATTDASGDYEIKNLPAGTYTVKALDSDYSFPEDNEDNAVTAGSTTSGVDLVGVSGKISGTITESDQQTAISGALVTAIDSSDNALTSDTTDANGNYELSYFDTGTYTVEVYLNNNLTASSSSVSVTDGSTTDQDFSAAGGSISGNVTDSSSTAISGAKMMAAGTNGIYETTTDASGDYEIEKLPAGDYVVTVETSDLVGIRLIDVTVTSGQETANQDFELETAGKISGTVTNSSQQAIEGAMVFAIRDGDENDANVVRIASTTDSNGNYTIDHLRAGTHKIYSTADNYVSEIDTNITVTAGQTNSGNDFSLGTSGGSISGTVYESDGTTPIPGAIVSAISDAHSFGTVIADSNGEYTLELLQAATYVIGAYTNGFDPECLVDIVVTGTQENSGNDFTLDAE